MSAITGIGEHDLGEAFGRLLLVARATNDVATRGSKSVDLLQRALDVSRLGDRHRLHRDRRTPTNQDRTDRDLLRLSTFGCPRGDFHDKTDATAR